ncbi:MAG: hypothetical protein VW455_09405 [Nitrospinota bacterium]
MVETQLLPRGIHDTEVLNSLLKVPRHLFVIPRYKELAYSDSALPITHDQTGLPPIN